MLSALVQKVCFGLLKWAGGLERQGQARRWWQYQAIMVSDPGEAIQWTRGATTGLLFHWAFCLWPAIASDEAKLLSAPRQRASKQHGGHSGSSSDALAVCQDCWWVSGLRAGMCRAGIGCFLVAQGCYGTEALLLRWLDATS